ncbi:hypothetical protein ACFRCG_04835 [Embleya sp. NPDC056575]|uniref:hypothetical protein n=1 Tax=unclassified Embleya TaxID=2699296 RepID=UPI0036BD1C88
MSDELRLLDESRESLVSMASEPVADAALGSRWAYAFRSALAWAVVVQVLVTQAIVSRLVHVLGR